MKKSPTSYEICKEIYDMVGAWEKLKYRKTVSHYQFFKLNNNFYKLTLSHYYITNELCLYRVKLKNIYSKNKDFSDFEFFEDALNYYTHRQNHLKNYAI